MTPDDNVLPFSLSERARRRAVLHLRELADRLEALPEAQVPDALLRLPLAELERAARLVLPDRPPGVQGVQRPRCPE